MMVPGKGMVIGENIQPLPMCTAPAVMFGCRQCWCPSECLVAVILTAGLHGRIGRRYTKAKPSLMQAINKTDISHSCVSQHDGLCLWKVESSKPKVASGNAGMLQTIAPRALPCMRTGCAT